MKRNSDYYPMSHQDRGELEERPVSIERAQHKSVVPRGKRLPYRCKGGPYDQGKLWLPEGQPDGTRATMNIHVGNWHGYYVIYKDTAVWQREWMERLVPTRK